MSKSRYIAVVLLISTVLTNATAMSAYKKLEAIRQERNTIKNELAQSKKENIQLRREKEKLSNVVEETNEQLQKTKKDLNTAKNKLKNNQSLSKPTRGSTGGYQTFSATAYCKCKKCCGRWSTSPTASGTTPKQGRTIAVDTNLIPMGSKVEIRGMGVFIAEDTGSAIKGRIVDIYHNNHSDALKFGRQQIQLKILK